MGSNLLKDIRYGARSLRKNRGFAIAAIVTLSLGIGATTSVFSVVNSVLLRPLSFKNSDELVWVWSRRPDNNKAPFALPDFLDYRDQNQTLIAIGAFSNVGLNLSGTERTERVPGIRVSANLFQLLGVEPSVGRLIFPQDDQPDHRHVAVLTYQSWQRRFAGEPQIVGRSLNLNGENYQVIGVLPGDFSLPFRDAELAIPLAPDVDPLRNKRNSVNFLRAVARLKPGVTREQAESDLNAIVMRQRQEFGEPYLKKTGVNLVPLYEETVGAVRTALLVLLGAVGLVLLIGCSNLAALSLTRASARYQEIAVKKALGATTARLVTQLLIESLMLALLGGAAGLLLATWAVRAFASLSASQLPRSQEIGIDLRVLAFTLGLSMLSAVVFGILPAWQGAKADMNNTLRASGRGAGDSARHNRWRNLLVIAEVALCFVLLIGAGLLLQSFRRVQSIEPGFDPTNTLAVRLSLPKATFKNRVDVASFNARLQQRIQNLPGVQDAGAISILPMSGSANTIPFTVARGADSPADTYTAQYRSVTPTYFSTMKIPLLQGRAFTEHDKPESVPIVVINETMARRLWPNGGAIGSQINIDDNNTGPRPVEIVGVVGNVKHLSLETEPTSDIYLPMAQVHEDNVGTITNSQYWVVKSTVESRSLEKSFVEELQKLNREAATSNIATLDEYLAESVAPRKFSLRILTLFSIAASCLR